MQKTKEIVNLIEESLAQIEAQLKLAKDHLRKAEVKENLINAQTRVELARSKLKQQLRLII